MSRIGWLAAILVGLGSFASSQTTGSNPTTTPTYVGGVSQVVTFTQQFWDDDDDGAPGNPGDEPAKTYTYTTYVCPQNPGEVKAHVRVSHKVTHGGSPQGEGRPTAEAPTQVQVTVTIPPGIKVDSFVVYTRGTSKEDPKPANAKQAKGHRLCQRIEETEA